MPVTAAQATTDAQTYLNTYVIGATTGDVTAFYGYYTIEILNGGTTYGMLKRQRLHWPSLVPHLAWNIHRRTAS